MKGSSRRRQRTELELLEEISRKFDLLIASVASIGKERTSQAKLLSSRFQPTEIADILGATPNAVRILLHRARAKKSRGEIGE